MILAILGLLTTTVFGILSIDLFRRKKNPGKLTLVKQSEVGLFSDIAKNFDEISIQYKNDAIKDNVIYLKASIINDGDIDIEGNKIEKPLTLILNEGLKWIKAKVTAKSPELICRNEINNDMRDLKFICGLIRKKEYFQFEALIETSNTNPKVEEIFNNITVSHRISNTQKVKQISLLSEEQIAKKKKRMKSLTIIFGVYLLIMIATFLIRILFFNYAPIEYKNDDNKYTANTTADKKIELTNIETDYEKIISIEEFQNKEKYLPIIADQTFWEKIENVAFVFALIIFMMILFIGMEYLEMRKSNKLYNIFISKTKE